MTYNKSDILDLVHEPYVLDNDHVLHKSSHPVVPTDFQNEIYDYRGVKVAANLPEFANKMIATMRHHSGLGLAAVQVGVLKKIILVDMGYLKSDGDQWPPGEEEIMINPEIEKTSLESREYKEGCLSFGNIYPKITRARHISLRYTDIDNKLKHFEGGDSLLVACIQHEIDHTNGIVFTDKLKYNEKLRQLKKYRKWREKVVKSGGV